MAKNTDLRDDLENFSPQKLIEVIWNKRIQEMDVVALKSSLYHVHVARVYVHLPQMSPTNKNE